jgi:hypothetical protein
VAREGLVGLSVTKHRNKRRRRPKSTRPQVPPRAPRPTRQRPERLNAPWHPFPLVELSVLVGIACIVVGLLKKNAAGHTLLAFGVALGALGGLDTTVREHWAGYREHTIVLATFPAVAAAVIVAVARAPLYVAVAVMAIVFVAAFVALRRVWDRKQATTA